VAAVSAIDQLLSNNRAFAPSPATPRRAPARRRRPARDTASSRSADGATGPRALGVRPSLQLAVVACMDSRLNVFAALGLRDGDAHVLRNAGGVITDDVIRSLAVSQRRLGTREVMLIHHTDCGLEGLSDDGFRAELQHATGVAPSFAIESFSDLDADVRQSILRVRRCAFLPHRDVVRGFVYDVETHLLREVDVAESA
jgi:carbonic anhydrase